VLFRVLLVSFSLFRPGVVVTCPAPRRHTAKKTESDCESIATLAGPNICTLIVVRALFSF
jgi:hypothetical protein